MLKNFVKILQLSIKVNIALSGNLKEIKKDFGKNRLILSANNYSLENLKKLCEDKFANLVNII